MKGKWKHCPGRRTPAREGVGFRTSRRGEEGPTSPGIKVEPVYFPSLLHEGFALGTC